MLLFAKQPNHLVRLELFDAQKTGVKRLKLNDLEFPLESVVSLVAAFQNAVFEDGCHAFELNGGYGNIVRVRCHTDFTFAGYTIPLDEKEAATFLRYLI